MSSLEHRALALLGISQQFHELRLRTRLLISQLPLLGTVAVALPLIAIVKPSMYTDRRFLIAALVLTLVTAACVAVPWEKLPAWAYWILPLSDFVAVGFLYSSGRPALTGLSLLCSFPIFWLAWSGISVRWAGVASFVGSTGVVWSPLIAAGRTSFTDLAAPMLVPFIMLALSITVSLMESDSSGQQDRLKMTEGELEGSLQESRLRSQLLDGVLDTIDVGVVVLDKRGRILLMNNRQRINHLLAKPLEGTPAGSTEGTMLMFGADRVTALPVAERPAERALNRESFSDYVVWVGAGPGQRALAVSARGLPDAEGCYGGSVLAFSDVTDLVQALQAKDDFVASVSHELRTPLTSIIGYLDLVSEEAEETDLPKSIRLPVQVALRNAERLLLLVSDLLTTAAGSMHLELQDVSVTELVHRSMASVAPRANAAGVVLIDKLEGPLPALVDPGRICQVLDNLLSNAVKYSPDGGTVTICGRREDGRLILEVQDTGMGMAEADQAEVFTKFFRTGPVRKAAIPGVGLGLVITKSIVEAHGGKVSFTSELGVGTTFILQFPVAAAP